MSSTILKQAQTISTTLENCLNSSSSQTQKLFSFIANIGQIFDVCGKSLNQQIEKIKQMLRQSQFKQNKQLSDLEGSIFQLFDKAGKQFKGLNKQLKQIVNKYRSTDLQKINQSKTQILDHSNSLVKEITDNLDSIHGIQQKIDESIKRSKESVKSPLFKRLNSLLKFDESKYRTEIFVTNKVWEGVQQRYGTLIQDVDVLNNLRCDSVRKLMLDLKNAFLQNISTAKLGQSKIDQIEINVPKFEDQLLQIVEQKYGRSQLIIKHSSLHRISSSLSTQIEKNQSNEQMANKMKQIDSICEYFMIKSSKLELFENIINGILKKDIKWGQYFLNTFCSKLFLEIELNTEKYSELWQILYEIFQTVKAKQKSRIQILYKLLIVSAKIVKQSSHQLMIKKLSEQKSYWERQDLWKQIADFLRIELQLQQQQKSEQSPKTKTKKQGLKSLMFVPSFIKTLAERIHPTEQSQNYNPLQCYEVLKELGLILNKLELSDKFIVKFLLDSVKRFGLSKDKLEKLMRSQRSQKKITTQSLSLLSKTHEAQKYSLRVENRFLFAIQKSLIFLPVDSFLVELRLVSKQFNSRLNFSIIERCIKQQPNLNLIQKYRSKLYVKIVPQIYSLQIYYKMKQSLPTFKTEQFKQIDLDAQRSLAWNPKLRQVLSEMLYVFSHYNDRIGYFQGMNYIVEHLLKLNLQEEVTYNILEHILVVFYSDIVTSDFQKMRLLFYQFHRLMEIHLPILHQHFENQKIEAEHYLIAWIMTLWGQHKGDMSWIVLDGLLIEGWTWWIKVVLWVLKIFETRLIQLNFEEILCFLNDEIPKGFLNAKFGQFEKFGVNDMSIKNDIQKFKVNTQIMDAIKEQYTYVMKRITEDEGLNESN